MAPAMSVDHEQPVFLSNRGQNAPGQTFKSKSIMNQKPTFEYSNSVNSVKFQHQHQTSTPMSNPHYNPDSQRLYTRRVSTEDAELLISLMHKAAQTDESSSSEDGCETNTKSPPVTQSRTKKASTKASTKTSSSKKTKTSSIKNKTSSTTTTVASRSKASSASSSPPKEADESGSSSMEKKLARNRLAAKRCRERKKQYIAYLETRIAFLQNSNDQIYGQLKLCRELQSVPST